MKVATIVGTRPEIIRLSRVIAALDRHFDHVLIHTGQNYDYELNQIFFEDLGIRKPDHYLDAAGETGAETAGQVISRVDKVLRDVRPDAVLILGDTNSCLAAYSAKRLKIPVFHMEAGNRCFDDRVPEEINRRIIDHCSDILMPYTHRSSENLVREGIERQRIFVTGNPIYEVLQTYSDQIESSDVLTRLGVEHGGYFLVTMHRSENVDDNARLEQFLQGLCLVADTYQLPAIISLHPRTAEKIRRFNLKPESEQLRLLEPFGFFDFVNLEQNARCVRSDSGTVQEECCIFQVPNVTIRDVTERPETIECGSNMLTGCDKHAILGAVTVALRTPANWQPPSEYLELHVARTVTKIVLGYHGF